MPTPLFAPRMGATARTVQVDGQPVHLLEAGAGDGPPLLLVHGASGGAGWFWRNVPALAAHRRVLLPDLPGFGLSWRPAGRPEVSYEWYGAFLGRLLDALDVPLVDAAGLSLGGAAVAHLALSRPGKVRRLVLIAAAALGPEIGYPFKLMAVPGLGELMMRPDPSLLRRFHEGFLYGRPGWADDEMLYYDYASQAVPGSVRTLLSMLRPEGRFHRVVLRGQREAAVTERLSELRLPTLVLWGERDRIFPASHGREAARRIRGASLEILPGLGHMPHFEAPERVNRELLAFLR